MPPFFTRSGSALLPAPHARGPWAPDMLHGRLLGGLLARSVEAEHGTAELRPARLTVDLYRNSRLVPLTVRTEVVRDGRRIRVVDAFVDGPDGTVARASCVMLRPGGQPPGTAWTAEPWDVPTPDELGEPNPRRGGSTPTFAMWRIGENDGDWSADQRRRVWMRETHPLVEGEELSPFTRAALAADLASPLAHWSTRGLNYINADYTLSLGRLPEGEVLGLEAGGHLSADGIASGHCVLYDLSGPLGHVDTIALANRRRASPPSG
ncbi:acyl-CoA thioesterase domain-containing protein [Actinocorallia populi]|uniref:acyl-CoA thioesterase domain-containing protein n=1 Tax=Actinocorallia populi TaxID=2079200 RepID=UPI001E49B01B|nr:acyl-CoA thioesterase domain-containing protein [Actinocorallia populi]